MSSERRAVLLLLSLAVAGHALRAWVTRPGDAPGQVSILGADPGRSPLAQRARALAASRPLGPAERIDVNHASASEIARLPRVGLALAKAIVADRESHGPFASLQDLDRVPGVGPGLLARVGEHVGFGGGAGNRASGHLPVPAAPPGLDHAAAALNLNTADSAALERLSGIGPYMAGRIIAYRSKHGAFGSVADLVRVPGVGPGTLSKVRGQLRVD